MCHPKVSEYEDFQIRRLTILFRITDSHTYNVRMTHPNEQQDIHFYLSSVPSDVPSEGIRVWGFTNPKTDYSVTNHRFSHSQHSDDTSERTTGHLFLSFLTPIPVLTLSPRTKSSSLSAMRHCHSRVQRCSGGRRSG